MNFMLNLSPQERDILAEILRLDAEYSALPEDKRAKFILSTDMRKEIRDLLKIEEKQFNVILSRLKKKTLFNKPLIDDHNYIHSELKFTPDSEGFKIEVNLVMTSAPTTNTPTIPEVEEEFVEVPAEVHEDVQEDVAPVEYKHDAAKAPVLEEETFDFTISDLND